MLIRACKLPRELCKYWEQYGTLGECITRLVSEGQDIMYIPRLVSRDECNTNRYIRIDDETTEMMVEMTKHSCNLANVLYYYQQLGYPQTAGWQKDTAYLRKQEMQFTNDIFAATNKLEIAASHWPAYEDVFRPIIEHLRGLRYVEE